jgi:hypothetical protein
VGSDSISRASIHAELDRARVDFHLLVTSSSAAERREATAGTRWTNEQLLFHMFLGYAVVRTLLPLVRAFSRLPDPASRVFARTLDIVARPFHVVNYLGPCVAVRVVRGRRLTALMDRTLASLDRRLDAETEDSLLLSMHFPVRWDPFFADRMTVLDVYHYGTVHFDFHRRQLTLRSPR